MVDSGDRRAKVTEACEASAAVARGCRTSTFQLCSLVWLFASSSLISPPGAFRCSARHAGFVRHFFCSAKFICMGKQKNRLTATKHKNRSVRLFYKWCSFESPLPSDSVRTHHFSMRRPWKASEAIEVPCRVAPTLYLPYTRTRTQRRRSGRLRRISYPTATL